MRMTDPYVQHMGTRLITATIATVFNPEWEEEALIAQHNAQDFSTGIQTSKKVILGKSKHRNKMTSVVESV